MTEFDDIFKFEDFTTTSDEDFEKASTDTVVTAVGREASMRTRPAKEEELDGSSFENFDEVTRELDKKVSHVMATPMDFSGSVQLSHLGDESDLIDVQNGFAEFQGFTASLRGDKVEYDYLFKVTLDQWSHVLSREDIEGYVSEGRESELVVASAQARAQDVAMNFDVIHPTRALAWLSISYPEIIDQVDLILFGTESTETEKLAALKDFSFFVSKDMPESEMTLLKKMIGEYCRGMATVDRYVPYEIDIDGDCLDMRDLKDLKKQPLKESALFSASYIDVYVEDVSTGERAPGLDCKIALFGVLHTPEVDQPGRPVAIPLENITDIRSPRFEYRTLQSSGENM
jgi:hypothetical protein